MATIADTGGTDPRDFDRGDVIRVHKFAAMTPNDVTAVIDTTGFDYALFHVGEGTLPSSGTTTFQVRGAMDNVGTTTGSIATEIGVHAPASATTTATSRVMGHLTVLPKYLVINANSGTGTSLDLWIELRKKNVHDRGR